MQKQILISNITYTAQYGNQYAAVLHGLVPESRRSKEKRPCSGL